MNSFNLKCTNEEKKEKKKGNRMNLFIAIYTATPWNFPTRTFNKPPRQVSPPLPGLLWKIIGDNEL